MNLGAGTISQVDVDQWVEKICSLREKEQGLRREKKDSWPERATERARGAPGSPVLQPPVPTIRPLEPRACLRFCEQLHGSLSRAKKWVPVTEIKDF